LGYCLGVDLGTTFTAAAIVKEGRAEMAVLGSRTAAVPTVVYIGADEQDVLVGEAARRRLSSDPSRVVREFKRRLGDATPIFVGGAPRSAESLLATVLRSVVDQVSEQEGAPPERTVVTHPANWGAYRRELLSHVIRQSDVPEVSTISEPEAAAIYYASTERIEPGELVAVYDLGGGTFDAALLRRTTNGFELVGSPEGIEHLGGIDIDEAIFQHVRLALGTVIDELDVDDPATVLALRRLREECTEAKETLSFDSRATVPVLLPGVQAEVVITRAELEPMIRPMLADTIAAVRRALGTAGVEPDALHAVLLVGGSSRIPLVAEMLTAALGRPVALDAHPKHAIALGAALTAAAGADGAPAGASALVDDTPGAEAEAIPAGGAAEGANGEPSRAPDETPAPSRTRRRVPVAVPVIGVVAAVALGAMVLLGGGGGDGDGGGGTATPTTASNTTEATGTTGTTATSATTEPTGFEIPASTPLDTATIAYVHVESGNCNVWLVNDDGSSPRALTNENAVCVQQPVLSPDRRSIAYTISDGDSWELWVADSFGDREQVLVDDLAPDARAAWSPDGNRIAYVSDRDGPKDIYILDLTTGEAENLTNSEAEEGSPAWSPDGERLAYWARLEGNMDIYAQDVSGGEPTRLTTDPGDDADPSWHPEGGVLTFGSSRDGDWDIYLMGDDGTEQRAITADPAADEDPTWSPDGTRIAFNSKRDTPERADFAEIYSMNADGSGLVRITSVDGLDAYPAWGGSG
jgi:actin-like ATPase involved in cell morphogenesis